MAAKQGLSAQISQASEDAKRGFLERTSLTKSLWFSNLNTTCTIKSAPPRTPDVLGMLSIKNGWLLKRNEQHVWQARYCCVVPHTFLYYFDQHPTNPCQTPQLTSKQQEELNKIVRQGFGKRGQSQPRSSLYNVLGTGGGGGANAAAGTAGDEAAELHNDDSAVPATGNSAQTSTSTVQPAGIIDMECYTTIHRSSQNDLVMELAGDETVNPDLRSFYFCANTDLEGEEWSQALLGQRHSSLVDEREAYKQVCDGFSQQLQILHTELDQAQRQAENQQEELYRVRSQMEDTRRNALRLVSEIMSSENSGNNSTRQAKKAYYTDLETIQAQDLGVLPAVQLLGDYTRVVEESCKDSGQKISNLEEKLASKQDVDTTKVKELEAQIQKMKEGALQQQASFQTQIDTLSQKLLQSKKACQDVQKDLASQRMEMTMYQSSTKTKLGSLQSHKKILKKEVIELRKKLEESNSELDLYRHRESANKHKVEQERQKSKLLERYVDKIESQVKVQQNMMEMMSQAGSVYGGGSAYGGSQFGGSLNPSSPPNVVRANSKPPTTISRDITQTVSQISSSPRHRKQESSDFGEVHDDEDDDGIDDEEENIPGNHLMGNRRGRGGRRALEDDNKSHMSELTEERTQKQFDAALLLYSTNPQLRAAMAGSPRIAGPPAIIGIAEEANSADHSNTGGPSMSSSKLDTIASTTMSISQRPPSSSGRSNRRPSSAPRRRDVSLERFSLDQTPSNADVSIGSIPPSPRSRKYSAPERVRQEPEKKLSVAQRARLEADRQTTPVRIRANQTPLRNNKHNRDSPSASSQASNSFFSRFGRRFEEAVDSSVLGVDTSYHTSDDDDSSSGSDSAYSHDRVKGSPRYAGSAVNTDVDTSIGDYHDSIREEKKMSEQASVTSTSVSLSLADRQALQRAQQLKFLKEQGLITKESDVRGGAGGDAQSVNSKSSHQRRVSPRMAPV
mmetsp:Transcript_22511/g.53132  ORF Transcript_22511/g.53132 Transcript_22511/m.53132 type:complete len:961 (+) Transcript_22511:300-3182(+)